ncbi:MAG: DUF1624 domain-containing protein [Methylosarcina sp.]
MHRLESIDMLRGVVIVLMALDHTRHFFTSAMFSPTDLGQTSVAYFLTRWITHLCAPTFIFLAGAGAFLVTRRRYLNPRQLAGYLVSRGIWLIILEMTLVRFGWTFNWDYRFLFGQVIWALGWSLLALAALVFFPRRATALLAVMIIAGHNVFDGIRSEDLPAWGWLWTILHDPGKIEFLPGNLIYVSYPLIPWIAVMAAGYCLGPLFLQPLQRRRKFLLLMGWACIVLFLLLRLTNLYGDPKPWTLQKDWVFTFLSLLNCTKYPPSLLYLLMTLGMMFFCLALFDKEKVQQIGRPLIVFGKAPLFFYLIHLPLIHGAMLAVTWFRGLPVDWLTTGTARSPLPKIPAPEFGYSLPAVYAFWLALLLLLYPMSYGIVEIKRKYPHISWLTYL